MKSFTTAILIMIVSGVSLAQALPSAQENYDTVPITYKGPITPGGEDVTLSGTVQEIHARILELNPDFNASYPIDTRDAEPEHNLKRRNKSKLLCSGPPGFDNPAFKGATGDGIGFLKGLPGGCAVGAGPGKCTRLSCSYASAIYLCNDNAWPIAPSCKYIASYAQDIVDKCSQSAFGGDVVVGQEFDTDHYNVIVAAGDC